MEFRRLNRDEAQAVAALARSWITAGFPMFPPAAMDYYLQPWTHEKLAARIDSGHDMLMAAFDAGEPVGIVSGTAPEGGVGTIVWLLVAESHQGKKFGRGLFDAAINSYRTMGAHKVKLTSPSAQATMFYKHCGMRVEGVHVNHWWNLDFTALGIDI